MSSLDGPSIRNNEIEENVTEEEAFESEEAELQVSYYTQLQH
jgi:hypothetical protein